MGGASRSKGARFERSVVNDLARWLGSDWQVKRNPTDRQRGEMGDAGDVIVTGGPFVFPFSIECKHYRELGREWVIRPDKGPLKRFWLQTCEQARIVGKVPLLLLRQDRGTTCAVMPKAAASQVVWRWSVERRVRMEVYGAEQVVCIVPWSELCKVEPIALGELAHAWG